MVNTKDNMNDKKERLMYVLVFTLIISVMNATMFNVALPSISEEFALFPSQVSWITSSYLIVYAIASVIYGKLADKYTIIKLLTFGIVILTLGSVLGLVSVNYEMIIIARVIQATGAGVIPALGMILPVRYFSAEKRGRALGIVAVGLALGTALGPIIAGFMTTLINWRILFVIPPLLLFTLPLYKKFLNDKELESKRIDFIGGVVLASTVACFLLTLTQGKLLLFVVGVCLLGIFVYRIHKTPAPFIHPEIFKNKSYSLGLIIIFAATTISSGFPFIIPQLLASVNQMTPALIGVVMLPSAVVTASLGAKGGGLADRKGNSFLINVASLFLLVGLLSLSSLVGLSPVYIAIFLIFGVMGQSFMQIAIMNSISQTLSKDQSGIGMGLVSMIIFIANASATAIIGRVLNTGTQNFALNPLVQQNSSILYSNIFLVLAILLLFIIPAYRYVFER
ncbi:MFS transporter [Salinicoccus sesuvii]|uniref:Quinolone resistance protein NorB n=1 Tax=Salinicoccus sesuvii TaxID=868281 RepID=A0ABV7N621_9STAP